MKPLLITLCLLAAGVALADDAGAGRMAGELAERFNAADTDHDGKLTQAEAQKGMPRVAKHFDEIDSGKQGYVTLPQLEAFLKAHAGERRGKPGGAADQ
jgi:hypothetical protein